jgi:hypothetical protein
LRTQNYDKGLEKFVRKFDPTVEGATGSSVAHLHRRIRTVNPLLSVGVLSFGTRLENPLFCSRRLFSAVVPVVLSHIAQYGVIPRLG